MIALAIDHVQDLLAVLLALPEAGGPVVPRPAAVCGWEEEEGGAREGKGRAVSEAGGGNTTPRRRRGQRARPTRRDATRRDNAITGRDRPPSLTFGDEHVLPVEEVAVRALPRELVHHARLEVDQQGPGHCMRAGGGGGGAEATGRRRA